MPNHASLGIDPGYESGGMAVLAPDGSLWCQGFKAMTERESYEMLKWVQATWTGTQVVLEQIRHRPGTPGPAICRLATHYGFLRGLLSSLAMPYIEVGPGVWMRKLGVPAKMTRPDRMKWLRQRAQELHPGVKITDQTAAAVLLAEYGRL